MPRGGVKLCNLRAPIHILDLDVGEGRCDVLIQEVPDQMRPEQRRPADEYRTVRVRFGSTFCCSAFLPECAMNMERPSPGSRPGFPVTVLRDSYFLDYLKASSNLAHEQRLRHWMLETYDGTLNVVCEQEPMLELVPVGIEWIKPEQRIRVEPPNFPGPRMIVGNNS